MRDETIEIELAGADQISHRLNIAACPFSCDTNAGFAHKGGRKSKAQRLFIKASEHNFAALAKPTDKQIQNTLRAARITNRGVIPALVGNRINNVITDMARTAQLIGFPHRRCFMAKRKRDTRNQPANNTMSNNEIRNARTLTRNRVIGGGR